MQTRDWSARGVDRIYGAGDPPQSARRPGRHLVFRNPARACAAITNRWAILWLERARRANPQQMRTPAYLASAYGLKNETARATAELTEARRLSTDDRFSSIARLKATGVYFGVAPKFAPYTRPLISPAYAKLECRKSELCP